MGSGEGAAGIGADRDGEGWAATRSWVEKGLSGEERIENVVRLRGGWTSEMRRLDLRGPRGPRSLVLRSFVKPFYVRHAEGLLTREATVLRLLGDTDVPAATLAAVDAAARSCDHPSLLMSLLPGTVRLGDQGVDGRAALLARQLVGIHGLAVTARDRPRPYQAWTSPERVRPPAATERPGLWQRAVDVIRRDPPAYRGCFLHRDFHPGNVLFAGSGDDLRISGVVDWVETSWGAADLDVAHCSTALALLHGIPAGMAFPDHYTAAGGTLADDDRAHLYWRLLDALGFAPDAEKVAVPWRELGRADLTPPVLAQRLEGYLQALFDR
ncbi:phosphotransferase [Streptomyces sp. G-G2]|uniref:phosphotransferase family protein n=1 Tax=Streptomyces sp. G-G2 TaxID=3046201 RepID=UPI0024BA1A2D|nr:phosphotransferase [Streptomyces sp. G-G2]MDJ0386214.1 phosphotransferase [Streptomyces sp. G-G2]